MSKASNKAMFLPGAADDETLKSRAPKQTAATAIVILNWRDPENTLSLVGQLTELYRRQDGLSIIVVDNGSAREHVDRLRASTHDFLLHLETVNRGFAEGCNIGARKAAQVGAEFVFFLNSDTRLGGNECLGLLLDLLSRRNDVAAVSPVEIHLPAGTVGAVEVRVDLNRGVTRNVKLPWLARIPSNTFVETDSPHGGMMLCRLATFLALGGFDESLFAYYEDTDYGLRARKSGLKCGVYLGACVYHEGAVSQRGLWGDEHNSPTRMLLGHRNSIRLVRKHGTGRQRLIFFSLFLPVRVSSMLLRAVFRGRFQMLQPLFMATADGCFGRITQEPSQRFRRLLKLI